MIGYKVFTPEWTAIKGKGGVDHPYQYEVGKCYEEPQKPKVVNTGFHFCVDLLECFNHYGIEVHNRIALVDAYGDIDTNGRAYSTNKIKIIKEIPWKDVPGILERQVVNADSSIDEKE